MSDDERYNDAPTEVVPSPSQHGASLHHDAPSSAEAVLHRGAGDADAIQKLQRRKSGKIPAAKSVMVPYQTSLEKTQIQVHLKGGPHGRVPGGAHEDFENVVFL